MSEELRCSKCGLLAEPGPAACDICGGTRFKRAAGSPPGPGPAVPFESGRRLSPTARPVLPPGAVAVTPPAGVRVSPPGPGPGLPADVPPRPPRSGQRLAAPARATNPVGVLRGIPVPVGIALGIPLGIALAALIISGFLNPSEFGGLGMAMRAAIFFPVAMFLAGLILFAALGRQMLGTALMIGA